MSVEFAQRIQLLMRENTRPSTRYIAAIRDTTVRELSNVIQLP